MPEYIPIFMFIVVGLSMGVMMLVMGWLCGKVLGHSRPDLAKQSAYECGFGPFEDARTQFDVRYHLVAVLFILFDLEIAFLFPWAVVLPEIGLQGFWAMMIFLFILVIGFIYEWKNGALEWD